MIFENRVHLTTLLVSPLKLSEFGQLFVNVVNIVNHNHTGGGHCLFFILHGDMSVGNNVAGIAHFMAERNRVSGNESDNRLFMLQIFIEIGADFFKVPPICPIMTITSVFSSW